MKQNKKTKTPNEPLPAELISLFETGEPALKDQIVLALIGNGYPRSDIAEELGVSTAEIKQKVKGKRPPPKARLRGIEIPVFQVETARPDRGLTTKRVARVAGELALQGQGLDKKYRSVKENYLKEVASACATSRSSMGEVARTLAVPFRDVRRAYRAQYVERKTAVQNISRTARPITNANNRQRRPY